MWVLVSIRSQYSVFSSDLSKNLQRPQEPVTYRLKDWQLMEGQNGNQTIRSTSPVLEKKVVHATSFSSNELLTGPCKPPYMRAFDVSTVNSNGASLAKNQSGIINASISNLLKTKHDTVKNSISNVR